MIHFDRLAQLERFVCYALGHAWSSDRPWERACCTRSGCESMRPPVRL